MDKKRLNEIIHESIQKLINEKLSIASSVTQATDMVFEYVLTNIDQMEYNTEDTMMVAYFTKKIRRVYWLFSNEREDRNVKLAPNNVGN